MSMSHDHSHHDHVAMMNHSHHGAHDHHGGGAMDPMTAVLNSSFVSSLAPEVLNHSSVVHDVDHSFHTSPANMEEEPMGHMMMYFHCGFTETVLFELWSFNTIGGLIGSMVAVCFLAIIYEGIKYFREFLMKKAIRSLSVYVSPGGKEKTMRTPCREMPLQYMDHMLVPSGLQMWSGGHVVQTLLHMVQLVISYCLMLIFMTYNVWLCLALTLGAGVGYFLFGWNKSVVVDVTEHCH